MYSVGLFKYNLHHCSSVLIFSNNDMYLTWQCPHSKLERRKVYLNLKTHSLVKISLKNYLSTLVPMLKNMILRKCWVLFLARVLSSPADFCKDC